MQVQSSEFLVLFMFFVFSLVSGIIVGRWCLKKSFYLGFDDFAYGLQNIFTWITSQFYQAILFISLLPCVFLLNCLIDNLMGRLSDHLYFDVSFAGIAACFLFWAMVIEGARRRRLYYEGVVPLRRIYRRFFKGQIIRPPFWELYRMW